VSTLTQHTSASSSYPVALPVRSSCRFIHNLRVIALTKNHLRQNITSAEIQVLSVVCLRLIRSVFRIQYTIMHVTTEVRCSWTSSYITACVTECQNYVISWLSLTDVGPWTQQRYLTFAATFITTRTHVYNYTSSDFHAYTRSRNLHSNVNLAARDCSIENLVA